MAPTRLVHAVQPDLPYSIVASGMSNLLHVWCSGNKMYRESILKMSLAKRNSGIIDPEHVTSKGLYLLLPFQQQHADLEQNIAMESRQQSNSLKS